jgi:diguanylate cyclase (GGDEF)-like protein/PAS domain S-box-containing protein
MRASSMGVHDGEEGRGLRVLFEKVPLGVMVLSPRGVLRWANGGALALVGRSLEEIVDRPLADFLHPDDRAAARQRMSSLVETGASPPLRDFRLLHSNGSMRRVEVTGSRMREGGEPVLVSMLRDVTRERELEERNARAVEALAAERALLDAILANVEDGVTLLDAEQRCVFANRAQAALFDATPGELVGLMPDEFFTRVAPVFEDPQALHQRIGAQKAEPARADDIFVLREPRRLMRRRAGPVQLGSGPGFLIVWRDVTVEHDRLAERERQSTTDPLTSLLNRRGAEAAAARERSRSERAGTPLSLVLFDIDHFKHVNDEHGHAVGDDVLRSVAQVMIALARVTDVLARWGGEEFVAILPGGVDGARSYAERTRAAVAALAPHTFRRPLTISAGIAELGLGEPFEAALARADANLYQAKRTGRDRIVG